MYPFKITFGSFPANTDTEILNINIPDLKLFYTASVWFNGYPLPISDVYGSDYVIGYHVLTSGTNVRITIRSSAQWTTSYRISGVIFYN